MEKAFDFSQFKFKETMESELVFFLLRYPDKSINDLSIKYRISSKYFAEIMEKAFAYYYITDEDNNTKAYFVNKFESDMLENNDIESLDEDEWFDRIMKCLRTAVLNSKIFNGKVKSWKPVWKRSLKIMRIINVEGMR